MKAKCGKCDVQFESSWDGASWQELCGVCTPAPSPDGHCCKCGGTWQAQWERTAKNWVCAGCYNEFAIQEGWEAQ